MKSRVLPLLTGGFLALFTLRIVAQPQPLVVSTVAGLPNFGHADGIGSAAKFLLPTGVALDGSNNLYVADGDNFTIRKVTLDGVVTTIAGQAQVYGTNDGMGTNALFGYPYGIAVDQAGDVFVADTVNDTIRKISTNGAVTTFAGQPTDPGANNGSITVATFDQPYGIAIDGSNNVYVADTGNSLIRKIAGGTVTSIGTSASPQFSTPYALAVDPAGNIYVADSGNDLIRRIAVGGTVSTVASSTIFNYPQGIAVDSATNIYVADTYNQIIRVIAGNNVFTLAGNDNVAGDGDGIFPQATFNEPWGVAVDATGNVYVGDSLNGNIRKIAPGGAVSTLAGPDESYGTGADGPVDGPAALARFYQPNEVAVDNASNIYVADSLNNCIREISSAGTVTTLAGSINGLPGAADGTNTGATFNDPTGICLDAATNIYVADLNNSTIRKMTPDASHSNWITMTIAGTAGINNYTNGPGTNAWFHNPYGVAVDGATNIYVTDVGNEVIRKIAANGNVTLYAGTPGAAGANNSTSNTQAQFSTPLGIAVDGSTNVYVADYDNNTIRLILPAGGVTNLNSFSGYSGPEGVAVDKGGNVYVANTGANTILGINFSDKSTINSAGADGFGIALTGSADGYGSAAEFDSPVGLAVDSAGNLYIADQFNNTIRKGTVYTAGLTAVLTLETSPSGLALAVNGASYPATPQVLTFSTGSTITNTALLNAGYVFTNWTTNNVPVIASSNYTFALTTNVTLVANYLPGYTLNVSASPSYAGTVSGAQGFLAGTTHIVTVMAFTNGGYVFTGWTTNGSATVASTSANYTFTLTNNLSLVANFAVSMAQQIGVSAGGSVITNNQTSPAVNFGSAPYGSIGPTVVFTVTNSGSQTLTLQTPGVPAGYTLTTNVPAMVAAGSSATFSVKLNTSAANAFSGNIVLTNNDSTHNPFAFGIMGTVAPDPLLITAQPQTIAYGATVPATTVNYTGFTNGDNAATLAVPPTLSSAQQGNAGAGVYAGNYTASGAVDNNYTISYAAGTLTVNPLAVILTGTRHYDGTTAATNSILMVSNSVGGDTVTVGSGSAVVAGKNIGTNAITSLGTLALAGAQSNNYTLTGASGKVIITPALLVITAQSQATTYGSNVPATIVTYSGFVNGETNTALTPGPSLSSVENGVVPAAIYTNNYTASGAVDTNYSISFVPGNLTVNPAPLLITVQSQAITVGATVPATTVSYSGFVNGDTPASLTTPPTISSTLTNAPPVGIYVSNYTASGAVDPNYSISYAAGTLFVNSLGPEIQVFNEGNVITNNQTNQPVSFGSNVLSSAAPVIVFTVTNAGEQMLSLETPIVPAGYTLTTNLPSTLPTGNAATFSVRLSTASIGTFAGPIVITNNDTNHNPFTFGITGTVLPAPLLITVQSRTNTYGSPVSATTVSYSGFINGDTSNSLTVQPVISSALSNVAPAGTYTSNYTASGAVDTNYTISYAAGNLIVNPAPLLIAAQPQTISYGQSVPPTTVIYSNFVNGDTAASLTIAPTISSAHSGLVAVGTYVNNYTASGAADPNYSISYAGGALTVNAGGPQIQVFNGTNAITNHETNPVDFGSVSLNGAAPMIRFVVSNVGGDPLNLGPVSVPPGYSVVTNPPATIAVGSNGVFSVQLSSSTLGIYPGDISFTNGDTNATPFSFPVTGSVNGALISLSGNLSFGVVVTNSSAQSTFTISNGGNATLTISNISFTNGFSAAWTNTLAAGSAETVIVTFSPTAPIYYHGVMTIISDAVMDGGTLPISGFGANTDATLTLLTNGQGKITPNDARTLKVGNHYTLTATPDSGNLFSNWSGSLNTNKTPLNFPMHDSMVLQANFVTNPFLPLIGTYNGLFAATNGVTEDTAGMLKGLTVNQKGAYSGSLLIAGASHAITGSFSLDEQATNIVKRSQGNLVMTMALVTNDSLRRITGFVNGTNSGVPWQAPLMADFATNTVPSSAYTMLMPPETNNPVALPGGDGYALINNVATPPKGAKATLTGALADGTAFSQAAPVSADGFVPVYSTLYSGKGLLLGWINLDLTSAHFGVNGLTWIHPARSSGSYKNGFTSVIGTNSSLLSAWTNAPFGDAVFRTLTNLSILATINDTNILTSVEVSVNESGQVIGTEVTGSIKAKTGLLTISVGKGAAKVTGHGVMLLNPTLGGGYYLTKTNTAQAIQLSP